MSLDEENTEQLAKDKLEAAIKEYSATVEPNVYIDAWVLIAHKLSTDLELKGATVVSQLTPTDQAWPMTAGLVRLSLVSIESPAHTDYEGEL